MNPSTREFMKGIVDTRLVQFGIPHVKDYAWFSNTAWEYWSKGKHISYRTLEKPVQCTGRASVHTFFTGHLTNQSNALDVTRYTHFLPDTWQTSPMHWMWLGTHISYRTPDKPIQRTGCDSVHTFLTGHLTNQSNALDVTWYTHFLPDTWQTSPMYWTWLGTHISYRTPDNPTQCTGRDSVHTTRQSCCSISKGVTLKRPRFKCVDLTNLQPILCCVMQYSTRVKMRTEYINVFNLIYFAFLTAPG